jgi:hypothetical protein
LVRRGIRVWLDDWARRFIGIMLWLNRRGKVPFTPPFFWLCFGGVNRIEVGTFNFTAAHILTCCLGVVMYTYYAFTKNWLMSNVFGLAVAFNSLEVILPNILDIADGSTSNSIHLWLDLFSLEDYSSTTFSSSLEQMSWSQ